MATFTAPLAVWLCQWPLYGRIMKFFASRCRPLLFTVAVGLATVSCNRYFAPVGPGSYTKLQVDSTVVGEPAYLQLYAPYKQRLEAEMNRIVGHADVALTKPGDAAETRLGNFFADALLAEGRKLHPGAEFSFGTKGGLRTELQRGPITVGSLFELMPFENELVMLELPGERVLQLARFIAATGGQPVAGLRMAINGGEPVGITVAGKPLDTSRTYQLITYDYLANGGDNLRGLDHPARRVNLGKKVREALMDYVNAEAANGRHITTQLDGRIKTHR